MTPFTIQIDDAVLDDLRQRIGATRWPVAVAAPEWDGGMDPGYLYALMKYWKDGYDWRRQEALLNGFAQFQTDVEGQELHLIHETSPHPGAVPLLLLHGWPGSVYEFYKVLPRLTDPPSHGGDAADAFHVVAPSLPGFAFSPPAPAGRGTPRAIAATLDRLMREALGYSRYVVQGGDWGSRIGTWMAFDRAEAVAGLHLNLFAMQPPLGPGTPPVTKEEQAFLDSEDRVRLDRSAYAIMHRARPQTLAYGLSDSPAGLAAWIVEKFREWSDCEGSVEKRFHKDELLTNVMLYWVNNAIGSSLRLYRERALSADALRPGDRIEVPTGYADFPKELWRPPRSWVERCYNIVHWTEMPAGGHFAALEEPERLVRDIRETFRPLRTAIGSA